MRFFQAGKDSTAWRCSKNIDMWQVLWSILEAKQIVFRTYWVKAHCDDDEQLYLQYQPSVTWIVGNACADMLASRGASAAEVDSHSVARVYSHLKVVSLVQKRLMAIVASQLVPRTRESLGGPTLVLTPPPW